MRSDNDPPSLWRPLQVTQPQRTEQQHQLLGGFDEKAYLAGKQLKPGDDPYREHAFNLQESDRLGSERAIRDTRHYRSEVNAATRVSSPFGVV